MSLPVKPYQTMSNLSNMFQHSVLLWSLVLVFVLGMKTYPVGGICTSMYLHVPPVVKSNPERNGTWPTHLGVVLTHVSLEVRCLSCPSGVLELHKAQRHRPWGRETTETHRGSKQTETTFHRLVRTFSRHRLTLHVVGRQLEFLDN